jgi:hypothetical protein
MSENCFAYFCPIVSNENDVWKYRKGIPADIAELELTYTSFGLKRGVHYTVKPLSTTEISDIIEAAGFIYGSLIPLIEICFRSRKHFDLARVKGLVHDAVGDATETPIWG